MEGSSQEIWLTLLSEENGTQEEPDGGAAVESDTVEAEPVASLGEPMSEESGTVPELGADGEIEGSPDADDSGVGDPE